MKILMLIVATCVVGALCEEKCEPGTTFMEDCNKCRCGPDGQKACTRKMCPPNELSDDSQVRLDVQNGESLSSADEKDEIHVQTNGQVCSPNEIKMKDCNRCRCANNGIGWFCTRRACPQRAKRSEPAPEKKCTPGTTFRSDDGCNTCFCTETGHAACTLKACLPPGFFDQQKPKQKRSVPADDLPQSAIAPGAPGFSCTPKSSFKYECNTCLCSDDGKMAGCTFKYCVPGEW